ncbi:DUF429 domain-containing protein [Thiohalocapsa halophila]
MSGPAGTAADGAAVGIDGCRGGWVWCRYAGGRWDGGVAADLAALRPVIAASALTLVDMPIGLIAAGADERGCDRAARALLGRPRASSIFRPPCRAALDARDYAHACEVNRRHTGRALSKQTWNIAAKIKEVDRLLAGDARLRKRLREAHPEVCLWGLAGGRAMQYNKRKPAGQAERRRLLSALDRDCLRHLDAVAQAHPRRAVARDDLLDAAILALTAALGLEDADALGRLPTVPEHDVIGLPMEIVYLRR